MKFLFDMKKIALSIILLGSLSAAFAQQSPILSIESCYTLAVENYPLIKQKTIIEKTSEYTLSNISKSYLPQLSINAQGTYQSAVTQLPIAIPGMNIEGVSKDQYKIYGEINQPLTDMIVLHQQKELIKSSAVVEGQKIDVELYKLRERINTIYFGILLVDEQMHQTELMRKDITNGLSKTESAIANGIALKSTALILKAELLRVDQRIIELKSTRKGLVEMLSIFINKPLNENSRFAIPLTLSNNNTINRPELKLFEVQRNSIAVQNKLINAKSIPRVGLFLQTGYGRPALNQLSNEFDTYYIGGLKLNWNISNYYTIRKEKKIVEFNQTAIDIQKESFLFNTSLSLSQQNNEIKKYSELLASDSEIITLRESVKTTASKQLENGTISANDYLNYINAEDQAKQNKLLHQIQLLMAQYNYQLTTGN